MNPRGENMRTTPTREVAPGEILASNPNDMPSEFDPRFDVEKPSQQAETNSQQREFNQEYIPTDIESLKRLSNHAWIEASKIKIDTRSRALGEGAFGSVQRGTLILEEGSETKKSVAVKRLKAETLDGKELKDFVEDAVLLSKIKHPCLVEVCGVGATGTMLTDAHSFFVASELIEGGMNLKQLLLHQMETPYRKLYRDQDVLRWCLQVARGLRFLHESRPRVIHRDLKTENIVLVGKDTFHMDAKVADFGWHSLVSHPVDAATAVAFQKAAAKRNYTRHNAGSSPTSPTYDQMSSNALLNSTNSMQMQRQNSNHVGLDGKISTIKLSAISGSLLYMAPEVFKQEDYDEKVDVFSFGMVMYELFMRELTFVAAKCRDQVSDVVSFVERVAMDGERPVIPDRIPVEISRLIRRCWSANVLERPAMSEVVEELKTFMDAHAMPQKAGQENSAFHSTAPSQCCVIS